MEKHEKMPKISIYFALMLGATLMVPVSTQDKPNMLVI
jgi:hypothetical protein